MAYTMDTTLGDILDNPQAKEVLEKYAPGVADNPMLSMARGLSLHNLVSMPQAKQLGLSEEKVRSLLDEINKRT